MIGSGLAGVSVRRKLMLSGVCPGVCTTSIFKLPIINVCPSFKPTWSNSYKPDVYLAIADGTGEKSRVAGIVRQDILSGSDGYILMAGTMHNSNVAPYGNVGQELWLDPVTPGGLTATKPGQPNEVVSLGYIIEAGSVGSFLVQLQTEPPPSTVIF
jgi:hypothetical protein